QVYRQMQGGVLDGLERRQHGVLVPNSPFFRGDFGRISRDGRLVNEVPLYCIGKRCFEKRMDFADGSRCQNTLLLCSAELLLFALNIEPFRGAAQGGIKLFQIICAYILYGQMPNIRHDQILDHSSGMGIGFRCPFVLAGLDRNPFFQQFGHGGGIWNQKGAILKFLFHRDFALLGFLLGLECFPTLAGFAVMVCIGVADGIRVAAFHNGCHGLPLLRARQTRNRNSACCPGCWCRCVVPESISWPCMCYRRHGRRWPAVGQSPPTGRQGARAWLSAVWFEVSRQRSWTLLLYRFRGCFARLCKGKNRWFESFSKAPPVPVHRLAHGGIQLAKPQVWNRRGRPCFAPEPASKFFLCGIQKYAPQPPSRPERALLGGFMGRRGGFAINRI